MTLAASAFVEEHAGAIPVERHDLEMGAGRSGTYPRSHEGVVQIAHRPSAPVEVSFSPRGHAVEVGMEVAARQAGELLLADGEGRGKTRRRQLRLEVAQRESTGKRRHAEAGQKRELVLSRRQFRLQGWGV
jgi:hypothetical protein